MFQALFSHWKVLIYSELIVVIRNHSYLQNDLIFYKNSLSTFSYAYFTGGTGGMNKSFNSSTESAFVHSVIPGFQTRLEDNN